MLKKLMLLPLNTAYLRQQFSQRARCPALMATLISTCAASHWDPSLSWAFLVLTQTYAPNGVDLLNGK